MPKIRDLGMNVIPELMPPPPGLPGGYLACIIFSWPPNIGCGTPSGQCEPHSTKPDVPNCPPHSNNPQPPPGPGPDQCAGASPVPDKYEARGFTPDAAAQLKQQLQNQLYDQLGTELVN